MVDFEDYDDDGYFSGDDLPIDEMNEVTDEWFESHLMDGCPIVDTPSTTSANHSKKDKKEHTKKNDIEIPMSDRKPPPEGIVQMESTNDEDVPPVQTLPAFQDTKDDNGLIFGLSCVGSCFTMDDECDHRKVKVHLNDVGQYVVFPSLWWHHGYYDIKDDEKVIFTAQLFATPSSDIGNTKRSNRRNSQMSTYSHGQLSTLNGLGEDLFLEWDHKYSADKFPPASNFLGRVDKAKNRHFLKHQIHLLPKIERLVLSFEEKFKDITVDSVWLIKKTKQDDGFQEWHQDMKTKITRTIVVNVGSGVVGLRVNEDNNMSMTETKEDDKNVAETTETKENAKNVAETNEDDEDVVLEVEVIPPGMCKDLSKKYFLSVADGWKYLAKVNPRDTFMLCHLNCHVCSPDAQYSILVGNDKFIHRYTYGQEYYKYEFISGFIALVQHTCHTDLPTYRLPGVSVTMVRRTPHPRAKVTASEVIELDGMTYLVSVACARRHFAVLFYDIERQQVIVYDGLFYNLGHGNIISPTPSRSMDCKG
jgi:hypothetical protein